MRVIHMTSLAVLLLTVRSRGDADLDPSDLTARLQDSVGPYGDDIMASSQDNVHPDASDITARLQDGVGLYGDDIMASSQDNVHPDASDITARLQGDVDPDVDGVRIRSQGDVVPDLGDIAVIPVSFLGDNDDPKDNVSPAPSPPPTAPPSPVSVPNLTEGAPVLTVYSDGRDNAAVNSKEDESNAMPADCSFNLHAGKDYGASNESLSYPLEKIQWALKDSVAEKALMAMQAARDRQADSSNRAPHHTGQPGPAQATGGTLHHHSHSKAGSSSSVSVGTHQVHPGLPSLTMTRDKNVFDSDARELAEDVSSGPSQPRGLAADHSSPDTSTQNENEEDGTVSQLSKPGLVQDSGGIHGISPGRLVVVVNPIGTQLTNTFSLNSPAVRNTQSSDKNFDEVFPSTGNNARFPQSSFFSPKRLSILAPNRAASSPFGFYGIRGLGPLASTGSGNDAAYTATDNGDTKATPFDVLNPFRLDKKFPMPRRRKRQAVASNPEVKAGCESESMLLREYRNHGDHCYVVMPEIQQLTFVKCSNARCSTCSKTASEPTGRCLPQMRSVAVWSWCERGPTARSVDMDVIQLPVLCTCKVVSCS